MFALSVLHCLNALNARWQINAKSALLVGLVISLEFVNIAITLFLDVTNALMRKHAPLAAEAFKNQQKINAFPAKYLILIASSVVSKFVLRALMDFILTNRMVYAQFVQLIALAAHPARIVPFVKWDILSTMKG